MLEIDLYRVRIGTFVPSFSPNSRKKSKNLYNSNSARLVLILIVLNHSCSLLCMKMKAM